MPEEDSATDMGNTHKKFGKDSACGSGDILAGRQTDRHTQTDRQTDILITILHNRSRGRSNNSNKYDPTSIISVAENPPKFPVFIYVTGVRDSINTVPFGHTARMDDDADAKMILTAPPPENWKRSPGRSRIT